jgi:hypothetical protein
VELEKGRQGMTERRPPGEITRGLGTTSDKIRALARACYDRTEISKLLGLRYQHVRNVLVGSGITGGLRREVEAMREPVTVDVGPSPREDISWEVLLNSGFELVGEWVLKSVGAIRLEASAPVKTGVYAFVTDEIVVYVGLSNSSFRTTFDQYRRGDERQRTRARVNKRIALALSQGKNVKVLVATPEPLEWHGLPVSTAAGLEAGLIQMIRPGWNIVGAG